MLNNITERGWVSNQIPPVCRVGGLFHPQVFRSTGLMDQGLVCWNDRLDVVKESGLCVTLACILLSDMEVNYRVWLILVGEWFGCNDVLCGLGGHIREVWSEPCNTNPQECTVDPVRWGHEERRKMRQDKKSRGLENRWVEMRKALWVEISWDELSLD